MTPAITLETKCWEGDWKRILTGGHLRLLSERNVYPFAEKILMINNVIKPSVVSRHAERAIQQGWITKYVIVSEHAAEALDFFSISRESLGIGYPYSIAELVGIFLCRSDYLLHFAGDCMPASASDWVSRALRLMSQNPRVKVCYLHPGENLGGEKPGLVDETEDFYTVRGFSDQCYLVRTEDFRQRIYNESHPSSARYPRYGGELFEKRVDSWLRNHDYLLATFKRSHYTHENWRLSLSDRIRILCAKSLRKI